MSDAKLENFPPSSSANHISGKQTFSTLYALPTLKTVPCSINCLEMAAVKVCFDQSCAKTSCSIFLADNFPFLLVEPEKTVEKLITVPLKIQTVVMLNEIKLQTATT